MIPIVNNSYGFLDKVFDCKRISINGVSGYLGSYSIPGVTGNYADVEMAKAIGMMVNMINSPLGMLAGADQVQALQTRKWAGSEPISFSAEIILHVYDKKSKAGWKNWEYLMTSVLPSGAGGTLGGFMGFINPGDRSAATDVSAVNDQVGKNAESFMDIFKKVMNTESNVGMLDRLKSAWRDFANDTKNTIEMMINPFKMPVNGSSSVVAEINGRRIINIPSSNRAARALIIKSSSVTLSENWCLDDEGILKPYWIKVNCEFESLSVVTGSLFSTWFPIGHIGKSEARFPRHASGNSSKLDQVEYDDDTNTIDPELLKDGYTGSDIYEEVKKVGSK